MDPKNSEKTDSGGGEFDCQFRLRENPIRHRRTVRIGCGAGFAGDRPSAALKLLKNVPGMNYLILECLAERTLANRYDAMITGGKGFDPRITKWMTLLLPVALQHGVCIITNMGAIDPLGAQDEVLKIAKSLDLEVTVSVAYETGNNTMKGMGSSTYLGAAPLVRVLESVKPDVIITSRTADAALFLAPIVFELGWNWDQFPELAQGTMTGHLLECGCQLTGGYFMHPGDRNRAMPGDQLLQASLPYADVSWNGEVILAKPAGSGGELSVATCSQQLLYEIGDPSAYITPDVIVDFNDVTFIPISEHKVLAKGAKPSSLKYPERLLCLVPEHCGSKGWGEISYGGACCEDRAAAADYLVRAWMDDTEPGTSDNILSYLIGKNSLGITVLRDQNENVHTPQPEEVRLRMDGLFESIDTAQRLTEEFEALYTNGPAGGGGIKTGYQEEILLHKILVSREDVLCKTASKVCSGRKVIAHSHINVESSISPEISERRNYEPAPSGVKIPLYQIAHGRTGDKGNQLNISLIPHCPNDLSRLASVISRDWMLEVLACLLESEFFACNSMGKVDIDGDACGIVSTHSDLRKRIERDFQVDMYLVRGVSALNVVVANVLDGGATCSRRIDRHGKSLSDLILCQRVVLPV